MDRILSHLVDDFLTEFEINSIDIGKDFQRFTIYSVVSSEYTQEFELEDVETGEGDDTGIDGIAIIINGKMIENKSDIDFLLQHIPQIEPTIVFVQATAENNFDSGKMNTFAFGVKDFFEEKPKLRRNESISQFAELTSYLIEKSDRLKHNPVCKLFYVCTGNWTNDKNNAAILSSAISDLEKTNLFSAVTFYALGASEIAKLYRNTKNTMTATFDFKEKITLPVLPGITESYYGVVPFNEFKKVLIDENGKIRNIFYDNVRDFYGLANPVNNGIEETLKDKQPELFTVLNNGITVVASSISKIGDKMTITDYSIVNGCQTSNVLYEFRDNVGVQDLRIPLKLIVTNDDAVKNKITIATNSQNAVKREQLQAMTEFQKNLEEYYKTYNKEDGLFYERRPKQYQRDATIPKSKIISIANQIKAFGAMFLNIPERVTTYFGSVVKIYVEGENDTKKPIIFNPLHKPIVYYTSALAYYRLDSLFRKKLIDAKYKKYKFFIVDLLHKCAIIGT
ncbi:MAG: AIPR family protein [Chloroflexi bacterium]|nr:AIPR family protein [Chloroflexota bacterium]